MGDVAILPPQTSLNHHKPARRPRRSPSPRPTRAQDRRISPPVVGPTRILKRGEEVMRVDGFYAGSGFVTSPPPSSVPLPAFFTAARRGCGGAASATATATEADIASGLRRLLKLQ